MTKSLLQIALLISVSTVAVLGFTSDVQAQCLGNRCNGLVDRLFTQSRSGFENRVLVGTNGTETDLTCIPVEGVYLQLSPANRPLFTEMYNSLLQAVTLGIPARIRVTNSGPCDIVYVILFRSSPAGATSQELLEEDEEK